MGTWQIQGKEVCMRGSDQRTPLGVTMRGLSAGAAGTLAMTIHQTLRSRLAQSEPADEGEDERKADPWESASVPAQVGRRVIKRVFDSDVPAERIGLLANVMHWSYGIAWGGVYAAGRGSLGARVPLAGLLFGAGVWAASYVQLVPIGLYEPPWRYSLGELADDVGYHLTYGLSVSFAYERLRRRGRS
jgi:hypothetical protein